MKTETVLLIVAGIAAVVFLICAAPEEGPAKFRYRAPVAELARIVFAAAAFAYLFGVRA